MDEKEQINLSHKITGIGSSVGLVGALMFGFFFEKRKISNVHIYINFSSSLLQTSALYLDMSYLHLLQILITH
jgi:hypothetical protein